MSAFSEETPDFGSEMPEYGRKETKKAPFNWKSLPVSLLIEYRDQITQCLPPIQLKDLNLEEEMALQYHGLRALQTEVLNDESLPLNQRAQVANATAKALENLVEAQSKVYTQERFKRIENLLIKTLNKLPEEQAVSFISDYEKIIAAE